LLRAWFGRAPDDALCARLELIHGLTRLYYAGVLLSASAAASWVTGATDLSAPTLQQFRLAIQEGANQARRARYQAHPRQDVPCIVFLRRRAAGIRRRRLAGLKPWQDG
jgi:hypothetical protein